MSSTSTIQPRHEQEYVDRTIRMVRRQQPETEESWPVWSGILADEVEDLRAMLLEIRERQAILERSAAEHESVATDLRRRLERARTECAKLTYVLGEGGSKS